MKNILSVIHCLRAYLLHTFQKRIDITAAEKFLATFRTQQPKQTCTDFIDQFMIKFEYYITVRWTAAEREAPNFRENANAIRLQYIREGLCREFKKHLDSNPNLATQQQIDDEAQRWARETIEEREFTKTCKKSDATHTTASLTLDTKLAQDDDDEDTHKLSSSTSGDRGPKGGSQRGQSGGARGGKAPTTNGKNTPRDPTPSSNIKQSKDADGINNFQQTADGRILLNYRGHPLCNYCGIPSHQRATCRLRLRDVDNGIKRPTHPSRGNLPSGNQLRKQAQAEMASALDQWGNPWTGAPPPPNPQPPGPQWPTHTNQPAPMTITITDPEDQRWLAQATSSGCDPASVITTCRQRQQQHSRATPAIENTPPTNPRVSSLLPSGLVACNECAHISATFEQSDDHYDANHARLTSGSNGRN